VVELPDQPASPKRPSRVTKPSLKVREAMQSLEDTAIASRKVSSVPRAWSRHGGHACQRA
jgi:hypothetical protein